MKCIYFRRLVERAIYAEVKARDVSTHAKTIKTLLLFSEHGCPVLCASHLFRKKNPNILSLLLTACWVSVAGGLLNGDKTDIMYLTSLFLC